MKSRITAAKFSVLIAAFTAILAFSTVSSANHQWGSYHWARTSNPFTIKLGDNLTSEWKSYLTQTSQDWTSSSVLNTTVVAGNSPDPRKCYPTSGRVELCNLAYGRNGWLGIASIWASGSHITQGTVKMNDSYYTMTKYNTPAWRQMVMCQEVGHTFGLDHQDENFSNYNLGTCMDYTNDPDGGGSYGPSNLHPNAHDYDELVTIYSHLDTSTTIRATTTQSGSDIDTSDPRSWGTAVRSDQAGRAIMFQRDLGHDQMLFTFVYWAEEPRGNRPE
jgi:hypothetical protein